MRTVAIAMFIIALCALALLTSTNVVTLFKGSHTIVGLTSNENDVSCISCHSKIAAELQNSSVHSNFKCEECHRLRQTAEGRTTEYATHNASGIFPGHQAHAAYTPRCLDCHGGDGYYINDTGVLKHAPPAYPFNETDYGSDYSAHKPLVLKARELNMSVGENEACLACHTNYSIDLSHTYFWNINYIVYNWNITQFSYNGTRYYNYTVTRSGAKHEFINSADIVCVNCHHNIKEAMKTGTSGSPYGENYKTHAPVEIDAQFWSSNNAWGHKRYHYIPSGASVGTVKCLKCHNVKRYADEHPTKSSTYDLGSVTADTNSTLVHAAEALTCATCHGSGKTKKVIDVLGTPGGNSYGHSNTNPDFVDLVASRYARTFDGDICMGCHEAAVHPNSGSCGYCHNFVNNNIMIESEPSGYATNTRN